MKLIRRVAAAVMALILLVSATGCTVSEEQQQQDFDRYIEGLPTKMISNDSMDLNFLFDDPSKFGFEETLLNLPFTTKEENEESEKQLKQMIREIQFFERSSLRPDQQETYDVLLDYLERVQLLNPYYYLDNNYLGSFLGLQAQLPLLLNEYEFNRKNDMDSYFHILETTEETFLKYTSLERERQKEGVGMSQTILDLVMEQCDNLTKEGDIFLVDSVNQKIDAVSFLSEEEKSQAKEKNSTLLKNNFLGAYKTLKQELSTIQGSSEDLGLAHLPNGKDYYAALLKYNTGLDMSPEEVANYLQNHLQKALLKMQADFQSAPDAAQRLQDGEEPVYSDFATVEETLDYLSKKITADYPPISNLNYTVYTVPEEMAENFSPAAYMQNHVDAPMDENESMYINGEYKQSLMPTLAHEGYPGHMYQNVYFKAQQKPTVRYLVNYNGYSEGWAKYVEMNSYNYGQDDADILQLARDNSEVTSYIIALMDIGVHYQGWDREQFSEYMRQFYGEGISQESCDRQFELILETPANYMKYYLSGAKFQDMYDEAEKSLGDKFTSIEYHEALLSIGPAPFDLLQARVDEYVMATQKGEKPSYEEDTFSDAA